MLKNPFTMITAFLAAVMFRSNIKGNLLDLQKKEEKTCYSVFPQNPLKAVSGYILYPVQMRLH